MKKLLMFFVYVASTLCMHAAQNPVSLKSGDKSAMKSEGTAVVVFDYSQATVYDEKRPIKWEEYASRNGIEAEKWALQVKNSEGAFVKKLSKQTKPMALVTEGEGDYTLTVRFSEVDFGDHSGGKVKLLSAFGSVKDGGARFSGEVILTDKEGKELCVLSFLNAKGDGGGNSIVRFVVGLMDLAGYIGKAIK